MSIEEFSAELGRLDRARDIKLRAAGRETLHLTMVNRSIDQAKLDPTGTATHEILSQDDVVMIAAFMQEAELRDKARSLNVYMQSRMSQAWLGNSFVIGEAIINNFRGEGPEIHAMVLCKDGRLRAGVAVDIYRAYAVKEKSPLKYGSLPAGTLFVPGTFTYEFGHKEELSFKTTSLAHALAWNLVPDID